VALVALDASVALHGPAGERAVPLADLYRLPGDTPHVETDLRPGELVGAVTVPAGGWTRRSTYLKLRDRRSYGFALVSVAAAVRLAGAGGVGDRVADVRLAAGGVGTVPWRLPAVEEALRGGPLTREAVEAAAAGAADGAEPLAHNGFKATLLRRAVAAALLSLGGTGD
jgi:xanthine dehydrogenase YagS FAD-binding subunit